MVLAKLLNDISIFSMVLAVIQGQSQSMNYILESQPLQFMNRIMSLSYLVVPIIAKIY